MLTLHVFAYCMAFFLIILRNRLRVLASQQNITQHNSEPVDSTLNICKTQTL